MFEKLVAASLRQKGAVAFLAIITAIFGWISFRGLTVEAFPDPTDTQVNVITLFPGQPSEEVERQVGLPLERALNGTPGLTRLRNMSLFGLSYITLTFQDGVDALPARAQVLERLRGADLPDGVTPELGPLATPIGEVFRYTLSGANGDPMALRTLQDWVVRPALMRVEGVADVVSQGGLEKEIHVEPDPERLAAFGLTLSDVEEGIKKGSVNASGGVLERGAEQLVLRSQGLFKSLEDLKEVHLATHQGTPVLLKDVAAVREGWAPRQGVVSRDVQQDTVEGIVLMRRGENPSVVLERLRAALSGVNRRLAPNQALLVTFYDRTELVDTTLRTVGHNLLEGAVLVTLVLTVFLMDFWAALIVAALIPLSLLSSFIYLKLRGMSANLLSMGAVDFGIIVDGGVVIIESILARLSHTSESEAEHSIEERILKAVRAVVRPTVFAMLIIIAAYLPIFMLQRVEGRIFSPMANTVVSALLGALIFSVTLVPMLAAIVYRKPKRHRPSLVLQWAERMYRPVLDLSLRRAGWVLGIATALLAGALFLLPRLGSEFLPELNEGGLYMTFTLPSNISLTEARKLVPRLYSLIATNPAVDAVVSQLGRPEDGTDAKLTNNLEFFVKLKPAEDWPPPMRELSQVVASLNNSVEEVPGLEVNFSQPIRDNVNESISGQSGQIAMKLYGDDLEELQKTAERVKAALATVPGVADLGIVKSGVVPQVRVKPNRAALARYDMDVADFQHAFEAALGGEPVGDFWEKEMRFPITLRLPASARDDVEKIRKLRVPVEGGALVPLEQLARVELGMGRASINRENGRRYIGIRMNVRGRDMGSFVADAQATVARKVPLPVGITSEWGGEFENKERAMARLSAVVPVALLLTLILLFQAFGSFGLAALTLMYVPFALVGGVYGLAVARLPLSVAAAVGFIALIGQASLNGVLVMSAVRDRRKRGEPLEQALREGCLERLRPVLMTASLAALGLIPAALSRGIGAETQRPLAVVIVAGTVSACALTLVLLPALYRLFVKLGERMSPRGGAQSEGDVRRGVLRILPVQAKPNA